MGLLDWLLNKDKVPGLTFREDPTTGAIYVELRQPEPVVTPSGPVNDAHWHLPGDRITIHGIDITAGFFYVGTSLQTYGSYGAFRNEPSLINPSLDIARKTTGKPLLYWRAYADLAPDQRTTYLTWLSTGRRDPAIDIHYVYIFLFGLERRVLTEIVDKPDSQAELLEIRDEVSRLLDLYGAISATFQDDANILLEIIDLLLPPGAISNPPPPPPLIEKGWEVPLSVRVRIGQFAASGIPIPPEWALAWVWYHPETRLRTPALRCPDELTRLFTHHYTRVYGQGLKARPGKARLRGVFQPSNFSLGPVPVDTELVPNTFEHKAPVRKLRDILMQATDNLDAYSRWIGRNPGRSGTLPALAQLPPELIDDTTGAGKAFRQWAHGHLAEGEPARIPGADLIALWAGDATDKLTKTQSTAFLDLAQRLGFGIEPDTRFGGPPLSAREPVVLFRLQPDAPTATDTAYGSALLLVHLAAAVAAADGRISRAEVGHLGSWVATSLQLSPAAQTRLFAHLLRLASTEIRLTGLKKRVEPLSADQRQAIGRVLVALASSDGTVSPEEVSMLIRIFRLLGLDPDTVTNRIHAALATGGATRAGASKTAPASASANGFTLDPDAIARIQAETATVSSLLSDIFIDEEPAAPPAAEPSPDQPGPDDAGDEDDIAFQGLDLPHGRLLVALTSRSEWPRADYEHLANRFHVMPGGAIDVINEVAFDIIGDPVIEGDDVLTINIDLIEELKA